MKGSNLCTVSNLRFFKYCTSGEMANAMDNPLRVSPLQVETFG